MMSLTNNTSGVLDMIRGGAMLVDVRSAEEFQTGSAPGAVNIPLNEIPANLAKFEGKDAIVVFCRSGNRSGQAQLFLKQNGIANVVNGGTWMDVAQLVQQAGN
ncbi:MAG: rhodanese-like domain-containing protein [Bacteroidetes bacterium]|nr:rhodanese-like domain-containing protein [Bacteroidota bacterium]MBL0019990.1 rhodanese-like domain-containing protein [Bacteroidota bacterium]